MDSKYNTQEIKWCIVPIPMPKIRKYIRGYNQAELIAKELSQKTSIPIKNNVLTRTYSPKRQVKSHTRNERLKNQHNSFQTTSSVNGLNIILVDDVITTGATIFEARNILQKSGANKVVAISLAH
ncbi:MAG: phosphoribosyltransferase family protein [Candidatus Paceibacterota bacterium]